MCNLPIMPPQNRNFLPILFFCVILVKHLGVDGCWCALWSSKPVIAVSSCIGGFNSHTFPPKAHSNRNGLFLFKISAIKKEEPKSVPLFLWLTIRLVRRMVQIRRGRASLPQSVHNPSRSRGRSAGGRSCRRFRAGRSKSCWCSSSSARPRRPSGYPSS